MNNQGVKMNNETFNVFSLHKCTNKFEKIETTKRRSLWQQNVIACYLLKLLRDLYRFNTVYVVSENTSMESLSKLKTNTTIDIFAFPMTLAVQEPLNIEPITEVFMWRFGFLMKKVEKDVFRRYYSNPFTRPLWNALYGMVILVSLLFYVQCWWDRKLYGGNWECSVGYELLIAIGASCQMSLPTETTLISRRLAYVVFFLFAFVIHSYFASQLLSHLVVQEEYDFGIVELMSTDIELLVLEEMQWIVNGLIPFNKNFSMVKPRLIKSREVNISTGLQAVVAGNAALLTDYDSLYPIMKRMLDRETICKLIEVDIFTNVPKYFFTSKDFPYTEEFKIGAGLTGLLHTRRVVWEVTRKGGWDVVWTHYSSCRFFCRFFEHESKDGQDEREWLVTYSRGRSLHGVLISLRVKEAGLLDRLFLKVNFYDCNDNSIVQTKFTQIFYPFITLICSCIISVLVMFGERWWYERNKVWPFTP